MVTALQEITSVATEWQPTADKIIVRVDPAKIKTEGGIEIPESHQERPRTGSVVAVGPGRMLENGHLKFVSMNVGDRVLFGPYAGIAVEELGDDYRVLRDDEVILVRRSF